MISRGAWKIVAMHSKRRIYLLNLASRGIQIYYRAVPGSDASVTGYVLAGRRLYL